MKRSTTRIDLSIIVVNFNTPDWTRKCLQSIQKFGVEKSGLKLQVFVVDNGSSDDSVKQIRQHFPQFELLLSPKNVGFSAGNNLALRKARSRYVMLLNSDAELTAKTKLDRLIEYMDEHEDVAVLTPRVSLDNGQIDPGCHRGEPTPWAALTYFSKLEKVFPRSKIFGQYHQGWSDLSTIHQVDACSGAAMIVRSVAIEKVGLLDEDFFMYAEDLDWCRRFREAGYSVVFHPGGEVIHHKYKSGLGQKAAVSQKVRGYFYETMLQYFDKHFRQQYPGWIRQLLVWFLNYKKGSA